MGKLETRLTSEARVIGGIPGPKAGGAEWREAIRELSGGTITLIKGRPA
jgi:hypothetical protein